MLVIRTIAELKVHLAQIPQNATIGFVPTMGALHQGHISLVDAAIKGADFIIVSIFINPIQFNNAADFEKYPATLEKDLLLLEGKAQMVFAPSIQEMYGNEKPKTTLHFGEVESVLEGAMRPGHFSGVGIVLSRLFNLIKPHKLYMGGKDYQQCRVVEQLINDLGFDIELIICHTIREPNGLAMSSRNERLSPETRAKAGLIYEVLQETSLKLKTTPFEELKAQALARLSTLPNFQLEYLSIFKMHSFTEESWPLNSETDYLLFIACWVEGVRLIDNIGFSI